ncbi:hypothetical protein AURANDRAFT_67334 [Aureococcus anophagefferens]|uniref:Uncharacterized protein n=1 Tax=Aureococcus anophagefferens TaxID=44056 RepID=F0YKT2_AURAN|nr:hypothetical protein AURANDRAFT_67334 [Aureococcus anophagefferens]EGB04310.1 hypothetical protein AURANDRAFT_67334 [Aureococcus anophagefferens]|eukprot:XP_009041020.1 hypothetical protein AURANDRAFT_67334 [Aureococcus anophagefferens]
MPHVGFQRGARNVDSCLTERACSCANLDGISKRGSRAMCLEGAAFVLSDERVLNSDNKPPLRRSVRSGQTCARSVVLHPCRVDLKSSNFTHGQQDGHGALPATIPVSSNIKGPSSPTPEAIASGHSRSIKAADARLAKNSYENTDILFTTTRCFLAGFQHRICPFEEHDKMTVHVSCLMGGNTKHMILQDIDAILISRPAVPRGTGGSVLGDTRIDVVTSYRIEHATDALVRCVVHNALGEPEQNKRSDNYYRELRSQQNLFGLKLSAKDKPTAATCRMTIPATTTFLSSLRYSDILPTRIAFIKCSSKRTYPWSIWLSSTVGVSIFGMCSLDWRWSLDHASLPHYLLMSIRENRAIHERLSKAHDLQRRRSAEHEKGIHSPRQVAIVECCPSGTDAPICHKRERDTPSNELSMNCTELRHRESTNVSGDARKFPEKRYESFLL